ncbi:hypothetical protein SAMN02799630_03952 [Paenibacillus sp. UNCCL117]|uniref:hypothetical protein n=1 Tax=unclassified Paenibacillus TaxID=185978 RepID=UPI000885CDDF|nr:MULTISPECIES: hypothetical protein [unclassified Paenibacillus]SDD75836.1 hypothetical protein SAMN04488602_11318 [Paenibacillus sp. cl123]SFW52281.1 hypothetical protein SAMN02799630_03952 [Paenibacillus sp. UNCCL117]
MEPSFFTWEALSTMGGASLLTFFIVQYTKRLLDRFYAWPTDYYAVIVAFSVLLLAQLARGADGGDWRLYALTFANSFLVSAAAAQMQNKSLHPPGTSEQETTVINR